MTDNEDAAAKAKRADEALNRAMRHKSKSAAVSQALVIIVFAALTASVFLLPWMFKTYLLFYDKPGWLFLPSMVNLYTALPPAFAADLCLYFMLRRIRAGEVFADSNVRSLRIISWCCYIECAVFFVFGFYFLISFAVSFACAFMGTVLRVVKNSFEEAVELKRENDFTI